VQWTIPCCADELVEYFLLQFCNGQGAATPIRHLLFTEDTKLHCRAMKLINDSPYKVYIKLIMFVGICSATKPNIKYKTALAAFSCGTSLYYEQQ